jgi:hypothetical protein
MRRLVDWLREYLLVWIFCSLLALFVICWNEWDDFWLNAPKASAYLAQHVWIGRLLCVPLIFVYSILLKFHFDKPDLSYRPSSGIVAIALLFVAAFIFGGFQTEGVDLIMLLSMAYVVGVVTFMSIGEVLVHRGVGEYLTTTRGEKWVREIEYIYLLLGTVSIISATTKFPNVTGHIAWLDVIAPLVLTFAVALRCVKTRAEIEGWNKPNFYVPRT